jgi:hypothetical protein
MECIGFEEGDILGDKRIIILKKYNKTYYYYYYLIQ